MKRIAGPFLLADPITGAEVQLATEVAKTLIDLNQNDFLINYDFTLSAKPGVNVLPLAEGSFALVNRTKIREFDSLYFHFTRKGIREKGIPSILNPFSLGADILLTPYVAINALTDTPSARSMERLHEVNGTYVIDDKKKVVLSTSTHSLRIQDQNNVFREYRDNSWLVLSLHSNYDTSKWDDLKKLQPAQELLERITHKKSASETIDTFLNASEIDEMISTLQKTKDEIQGGIFPRTISFATASSPYKFSVNFPGNEKLESINYFFNKQTIQIAGPTRIPSDRLMQYSFNIIRANPLVLGEYIVNVVTEAGKIYSYSFNVEP